MLHIVPLMHEQNSGWLFHTEVYFITIGDQMTYMERNENDNNRIGF